MRRSLTWILAAVVLGCRGGEGDADASDSTALQEREAKVQQALAETDSAKSGEPIARWLLPTDLGEISGMTLTDDGRLFAHNDEAARVSQVDYRRGIIVKQFFVGKEALRADFEGIAWARDRFYMLASNGTLYEFREGAEGERVDYTLHDTRLGKECEFEGVAFDSTANALVLACKNVEAASLQGSLLLYRYTLGDSGAARTTELAIPMADAIGKNRWKQVRPTDIAVDPLTGNYVLVAAQERAILSITPTGQVLFSRPLGGRHPQSEGLAITRDSILIIGDETVSQPGTITLYKWP